MVLKNIILLHRGNIFSNICEEFWNCPYTLKPPRVAQTQINLTIYIDIQKRF